MTVTLDEDGKVVKAEDRYFSNPIREDGEKNWKQIYPISIEENGRITYRYRTGNDIKDVENLFVRWQCNGKVLCETYILGGYIPGFDIVEATSNLEVLTQVNAVSIDDNSIDIGYSYVLEAFLVDGNHYDDPDLKEEYKINKAEYPFGKIE